MSGFRKKSKTEELESQVHVVLVPAKGHQDTAKRLVVFLRKIIEKAVEDNKAGGAHAQIDAIVIAATKAAYQYDSKEITQIRVWAMFSHDENGIGRIEQRITINIAEIQKVRCE